MGFSVGDLVAIVALPARCEESDLIGRTGVVIGTGGCLGVLDYWVQEQVTGRIFHLTDEHLERPPASLRVPKEPIFEEKHSAANFYKPSTMTTKYHYDIKMKSFLDPKIQHWLKAMPWVQSKIALSAMSACLLGTGMIGWDDERGLYWRSSGERILGDPGGE